MGAYTVICLQIIAQGIMLTYILVYEWGPCLKRIYWQTVSAPYIYISLLGVDTAFIIQWRKPITGQNVKTTHLTPEH